MVESEYILGTEREEIERLRFQHQVWVEAAYALWGRAGFRFGDVLLDLGCGPGFTSFELALVVGPKGTVIARDKSPRFLEFLRVERDRLSRAQIETSLGPVEELDLGREHLDGAYARWLLCWVPDPGAVLERVARSLKRGGRLALQEYLDWGAMKLVPRSESFARAVEACMQSFGAGEATIDIGDHIPSLAERCGLQVEYFQPLARLGRAGSPEWKWLAQFLGSYLPKLVDQGLLERDELDGCLRDLDERTEEGSSYCYTPTMVDVLLRKP